MYQRYFFMDKNIAQRLFVFDNVDHDDDDCDDDDDDDGCKCQLSTSRVICM